MPRTRTKQIYRRADGETSIVIKRSIIINGHKTSVSLEDQFWRVFKAIQAEENGGLEEGDPKRSSLSSMAAYIDATRPKGANLSCAIRLFVLDRLLTEVPQFRAAPTPVKRAA